MRKTPDYPSHILHSANQVQTKLGRLNVRPITLFKFGNNF